MSDDERLTGHEYDGIREYDNPLPGWWSGIFVLTIVFAIAYAWWFHGGGPGKSIHEEFDRDWRAYAAWKAEADRNAVIVVTDPMLADLAHDSSAVAAGRAIFVKNCVGCHLDDGRGQVGPNLTDDYQIHGATRLDLYQTIHDGVPTKGMVTWSATMAPKDMAQVAAYVSTLRGTRVRGKPPEGAKVEAFPP